MLTGSKRRRSELTRKTEYDRLQTKIARLEQMKADLFEAGDCAKFRLSFIQENDDDIMLYTGFPNCIALMTFFDFLELGQNGMNLKYYYGEIEDSRLSHLTLENEMLITLIKLKLGLSHDDLAYRFGLELNVVHSIFEAWLNLINDRLSAVDIWLSRREIDRTIPLFVLRELPKTRIIFHDVNLKTVQASDWNFSDLNAIVTPKRAILGFSPSGKVTFISPVSLIRDTSLKAYEVLKDITFEDTDTYISTVKDHSLFQRLNLLNEHSPDFQKTKRNRTEETRLERHIWNIVERLENFKILERNLPNEEADTILNVCCRLVNFQHPMEEFS